MPASPQDPAQALAQTRLDNALALFEEFVRATARHADAATLRGLERRFAERIQVQPSYWSQIKGRSRQIGERLARQFEHLCQKPHGWMDVAHGGAAAEADARVDAVRAAPGARAAQATQATQAAQASEGAPRDDDERFIVGLVLTYYRRHPQRARTRLLDLLGEVLTATPSAPAPAVTTAPGHQAAAGGAGAALGRRPLAPAAEDAHALWLHSQAGVAPLKRKK